MMGVLKQVENGMHTLAHTKFLHHASLGLMCMLSAVSSQLKVTKRM